MSRSHVRDRHRMENEKNRGTVPTRPPAARRHRRDSRKIAPRQEAAQLHPPPPSAQEAVFGLFPLPWPFQQLAVHTLPTRPSDELVNNDRSILDQIRQSGDHHRITLKVVSKRLHIWQSGTPLLAASPAAIGFRSRRNGYSTRGNEQKMTAVSPRLYQTSPGQGSTCDDAIY